LCGSGVVVEIDEAKIGHRKYNRGRSVDGFWVFGGFERGSGRTSCACADAEFADAAIGYSKLNTAWHNDNV